jgi:DNA-cytosine methyltransferase
MKTFASLFSGGGGADIGAIDAGLKPIWGVEYIPKIAEWYGVNIGHPAIVESVLTVNFAELESPFWLHASPPCVTASVANAKAGESLMDAALAAAVCEAIDALLPEWFSLENVGGYRSYASYAAIKDTLADNGYRMVEGVLNSADYGVPQTRRRLFLVASRTAAPVLPRPTHSDKEAAQMQLSMFDASLLPWVGWYEAIADLLPGCPDSKLAEWQLKRLPESLTRSLQVASDNASNAVTRHEAAPAFTVVANFNEKGTVPRALLLSAENGSSAVRRDAGSPSMAIRAGIAEHNSEPRALLMPHNGQYAEPRDSDARSVTISAEHGERTRLRAVLYAPNRSTWESANIPTAADEPAPTLRANRERYGFTKAIVGYTCKRLTPRCLFRLQGVPDTYRIPDDRRLAGRIAGNMVCPPVMRAIVEANL